MSIKKSDVFKKVYENRRKASLSQDKVLNKSLSKVPLSPNQLVLIQEILPMYTEYQEITSCIALTETLCTYLSASEEIVSDVDLFDSDLASVLVLKISEGLEQKPQ